MKQVLAIEDDATIVDLLEIHLKDLSCSLTKTYNGTDGLSKVGKQAFDLIVLDLMLPGMHGLDVCRKIRAEQIFTPILILTAKSEEKDIVNGLEAGADDYLIKPFGVREFIARVKAILRRGDIGIGKAPVFDKKFVFNALEIDEEKRKVSLGKQRVDLTRKEFDLLLLLASHPGRSYSREQILNLIWGYEFAGFEHTVNSHINRLRAKIEPDINQPKYILTTWGVGYRFSEEVVR
ncbi:MAG: response regulator transcription factor [Bacteroidota bacterium]